MLKFLTSSARTASCHLFGESDGGRNALFSNSLSEPAAGSAILMEPIRNWPGALEEAWPKGSA